MKVFDLLCANGHQFEGWFASEKAYQEQLERSLLACPICGGQEISKVMSAPRLQRKSNQKAGQGDETQKPHVSIPSEPQVPSPLMQAKLEAQIRDYIIKNTEDVGEQFAQEARKIHYGEADERNIWGQATQEEAQELGEEGIEIVPLPFMPVSKNHLQ